MYVLVKVWKLTEMSKSFCIIKYKNQSGSNMLMKVKATLVHQRERGGAWRDGGVCNLHIHEIYACTIFKTILSHFKKGKTITEISEQAKIKTSGSGKRRWKRNSQIFFFQRKVWNFFKREKEGEKKRSESSGWWGNEICSTELFTKLVILLLADNESYVKVCFINSCERSRFLLTRW